MPERINRRIVLNSRPQGIPNADNFRMETAAIPHPGAGEILVRNRYISIDPGMRSRLNDEITYAPPLQLNEVIQSASLGVVEKSEDPGFDTGDVVVAGLGWQEWGISKAKGLRKWSRTDVPETAAIGVMGIPGLTAYFGLLALGQPRAGETLLISSAAGTVGATAGQIGRLKGVRTVGIAGGADKCNWLERELKFDGVIDYKACEDLDQAIRDTCGNGVDIYFDNVGAHMLRAAIRAANLNARLIISGQIAEYNKPESERVGINDTLPFISKRLRMQGLVVFDYAKDFPKAWDDLGAWIRSGDLTYKEEVVDGLENAPSAFAALFEGGSFGRKLIRVS